MDNSGFRQVTGSFQLGKLTTEHIIVQAIDEKDIDGANHKYIISVWELPLSEVNPLDNNVIENCELNFQQGGLKEAGINGISDQALLAIVMDRMCGFQKGPYRCDENDEVIKHLDEIHRIMKKRYADRAARGVEGERKV